MLITGAGGVEKAPGAPCSREASWARAIGSLLLTDQVDPPADLRADARVNVRTGPLLSVCARACAARPSTACSTWPRPCRANASWTSTWACAPTSIARALLEACAAIAGRRGAAAHGVLQLGRGVRPRSLAALDGPGGRRRLPAPQTSYGTHKLMCRYLLADYTRKGFIDGRSARLMTVTVRPGQPNGAASGFFSGIIREPLAGVETTCPVDAQVSHPMSSPTARWPA